MLIFKVTQYTIELNYCDIWPCWCCCCCCCCCLRDLNQQLGYVHHHHHIFKMLFSKVFRKQQYVYGKFKYYQKQARYVCIVYMFQRKRQDFYSHFYSISHIYKSIFLLIKNAITVRFSTKFTNNNNNNNNTLLLLSYVPLHVTPLTGRAIKPQHQGHMLGYVMCPTSTV